MRKKYFTKTNISFEENLINLTPLIDVVFVVLIAFILIAPLIEIDQINLATSSESSSKDLPKKSPLTIYVREDDSIWVNNQIIPEINLKSFFKDPRKKYPTTSPQIYHDKKATFGCYQKIKGALESAGFKQMDIILKS